MDTRRRAAIAVGLALATLPVAAQTNDHVFRSWRWSEDIGSPRAAGLAGAFVAVADDSSATFLNPAGLALLPKTELEGSVLSAGSSTVGLIGDHLSSRMDPGSFAGGGLIAKRLAIGAYLTRAQHSHVVLDSTSPALSDESGFLDMEVTDAGAALAWHPIDRVYIGGRLNVSHLALEGLWNIAPTLPASVKRSAEALQVGLNAGTSRVVVDGGVLVQVTESVRFGIVHRQGVSWEVNRTASNPTLRTQLDARSTELRSPSTFAAGLSWRVSPQVLVSTQLDYVLYGSLQSNLDIRHEAFARDDYALSNAFEPRVGLEFSRRVGAVSLQLRGGIYSQAPGSLAYSGTDADEAAAFQAAKRRTLIATGVSVITRVGLRLDASALFGGDGTQVTGGVALRF
jgi:hypothetical protein